jgi:hypothetical protein
VHTELSNHNNPRTEVVMSFVKSSALVVSAACGAAALACRATIKMGPNSLLGETTVTLEVDKPICTLPATPENPPAGSCVKLSFFDEDGNVIGEAEATVGGTGVAAPSGTDSIVANQCDPPPPEPEPAAKPGKKKKVTGAGPQLLAAQRHGYHLIPYAIEDGVGRYASYEVEAHSKAQADQISAEFVQGMLVEAPPTNVTPYAVVRTKLMPDGSVMVSMFTDDAPQSLSFRWNDGPALALGDASVVSNEAWHVTSVSIPASHVDASVLGSTNRLEYVIALADRDVGTTLELEIQP